MEETAKIVVFFSTSVPIKAFGAKIANFVPHYIEKNFMDLSQPLSGSIAENRQKESDAAILYYI